MKVVKPVSIKDIDKFLQIRNKIGPMVNIKAGRQTRQSLLKVTKKRAHPPRIGLPPLFPPPLPKKRKRDGRELRHKAQVATVPKDPKSKGKAFSPHKIRS